MIKYLLLLLLASFSVEAQIVNIPDANFKVKLLEASPDNQIANNQFGQYFKIDANDDGEIQESEAVQVISLNVSNSNISSIEGIQSFINLKIIRASYNNLMQVDFNGLSGLHSIYLDNNQINFEGLIGLGTVSSNLVMLELQNNAFTYFDLIELFGVDNYNEINYLNLSNNPLSYFNFNFLNILVYDLKLINTSLLSINIVDSINVVSLHLKENQVLTSINFFLSVNVNFRNLVISENPLLNNFSFSCTGSNSFEDFSIINNIQLSTINLNKFDYGNGFFIQNCPLNILSISNSSFSGINLDNVNLETLDLSDTKFGDLDLTNNLFLKHINVKNGDFNNFYGVINCNNLPQLEYVCANEWHIQDILDTTFSDEFPNVNVNSYCSFTPGGEFFTIQGNSKLDLTANGCEENDIDFPNMKFNITNGTISGNIISNTSGDYSIPVQEGTHTVTPVFENPTYFNISPENFAVTFPTETSPFIQNFCITPNGIHQDVEVVIVPLNAANPGFDANYKLVYKNKGNTVVSGTLSLTFTDNVMDFVSSTPVQSMEEPNILNWNYTNLQPFETREIEVVFNLNSPQESPALNGGEILEFIAIVDPLSGDEMPSDNTSTLNQEVVNSFDPNDKTCLEGSVVSTELIGQYVHYVIRFENTGTFFAQNVVVKDEIDLSKFDLNSLIVLSASHQQWTRINGNKVEFIFENIQLPFPPSEERYGYIAFKIKLKNNLAVGDTFSNFASIYFDYNFPIITEPATTSIEALSNPDFEFSSFVKLYPNPASSVVTIESQTINLKSVEIFNSLGQLIQANPNENNQLNIDVSGLQTGTYFVKVNSDKGVGVSKFVKQ